jgi:hypothetical protein
MYDERRRGISADGDIEDNHGRSTSGDRDIDGDLGSSTGGDKDIEDNHGKNASVVDEELRMIMGGPQVEMMSLRTIMWETQVEKGTLRMKEHRRRSGILFCS